MQVLLMTFIFFITSFIGNDPKLKESIPSSTNIVYTSEDGGQTWKDISAGLPPDLQPNCIFDDGTEVYLGYEGGLYSSISGIKSMKWEKNIYLPSTILSFYWGKAGPYARTNGKGIYQKMPVTGLWRPVYTSIKNEFVRTILENTDGTILAGAEKGIFKSFDGGQSWKKVLAEEMITSLVAKDGVVVGGSSKGILRSDDNGDHWDYVHAKEGFAEVTGTVDGQFVAITYEEDESKQFMLKPGGLVNRVRISQDRGKTWQNTDKMISPYEYISDIHQSGQYYISSNDKGIFRSSDKGKSWKQVLPSKNKMMISQSSSGKVMYAFKEFNGC